MLKNKILGLIPSLLIVIGFVFVGIFVHLTTEATKDRQLQGQTYARFVACSLSFPPGTRTEADIDFCWVTAMEDTGKEVKRYDDLSGQ